MLTNLVDGQRWRCGHVADYSCRVRQETVGTVGETCDWALTVTCRSLGTTSAQPRCLLYPLRWERAWRTVQRQVLRSWRPGSPTGTCSAVVSPSCVTTARRSLNQRWKQICIVNINQIFTARRYASAVYAMGLCPCLCLSVCLSQVGGLLKQLNVGSNKQHGTMAQGLYHSKSHPADEKSSLKGAWSMSGIWGRRMQVGWRLSTNNRLYLDA